MYLKNVGAAAIAAMVMSSMCYAGDYKSPAPWNENTNYKGSYLLGQGDTVSYGTFNGKSLYWWAKFAAGPVEKNTDANGNIVYIPNSSPKPGEFAAEGGTSPWVLINSLSAAASGGRPNFTAVTWNGDNGSIALNGIPSGQAKVPTWRDAANGAYSITLDDYGGMPFDKSVLPGWEATRPFPDIKMAWGIIVGKTKDEDWKKAIEMVADGQEMFNHTIDHTSAADQWQIYYPGKKVSETDPAVPPSVRGLEVVGTWKITATSSFGKVIGPVDLGPSSWNGTIDTNAISNTGNPILFDKTANGAFDDGKTVGSVWQNATWKIKAESDMVTIEMPAYWTGYDPATGYPWNDPDVRVTPKSTYNGIPIQTVELKGGQKVYVAYTKYNPNASEFEGYQEGYIAATGVQWFDEGRILDDYPFYYNGLYVKTDWTSPGCASGCDKSGTPGRLVTHLDQGRPGFVAKLFCINGWDGGTGVAGPQTRRNVDTANAIINNNIYKRVTTAGEYFAKGKRSEYFGYPYDAYSEKTHDHLFHGVNHPDAGKFVGARGGAKSGKPMSGDFYHPFRLDFDAFYINKSTWTAGNSAQVEYLYPNNPHVLLGINQMVDEIVKANGYMIRELHAVADIDDGAWYQGDESDLWAINNSGLGQGGWWGGITKKQLSDHLSHIQGLIDQRKITVITPSEAVKYRMTANAVETNATLTPDGQNWKVKLNIKSGETVDDVHKEEISVIVNLGTAVSKLAVAYDGNPTNTSADNSPRRKPKKMDNDGKFWSVSINPFKTADHSALLIKDGEWFGQGTDFNTDGTFEKPGNVGVSQVAKRTVGMSFAGIRNGQIALNLRKGVYTAELYNLQGRLINSVSVDALDGVNITNLKTSNLAKGLVILNVKQAGASVLQHKIMIK